MLQNGCSVGINRGLAQAPATARKYLVLFRTFVWKSADSATQETHEVWRATRLQRQTCNATTDSASHRQVCYNATRIAILDHCQICESNLNIASTLIMTQLLTSCTGVLLHQKLQLPRHDTNVRITLASCISHSNAQDRLPMWQRQKDLRENGSESTTEALMQMLMMTNRIPTRPDWHWQRGMPIDSRYSKPKIKQRCFARPFPFL